MLKKLLERKKVVKSFTLEIKAVNESEHIIEGVFSTPDEDRHDEVVMQTGWDLTNYKSNPVVLWAHDSYEFPIAQMVEIGIDVNGNLAGKMKFAVDEYEKAATAYALMVGKYLRAFSVGFSNNKYQVDQENEVVYLMENELFEVSVVNIPANQMALAKAKSDGIDVSSFDIEEKSAVPYKDMGMADEGMAWDGSMQMSACDDDLKKLKAICAWYDETNPEVKSSYKLPHHEADDMKAVWKGVTAAMGALLGARGGTTIPDGDRQAVYNHLAKHYKQFGKDVPEFKDYSEIEIKQISSGQPLKKSGSVLSAKNRAAIEAAINVLNEVLASADENKNLRANNDDKIKKVETPAFKGGQNHNRKINKLVRNLLREKTQ